MNRFFRSLFYIFTISAVLLMSVMGTTTVYADGGTSDEPAAAEPPAEPPEEPSAEPDDASPAPAEITEEPSGDEIPPAETTPAEAPAAVTEIMEQVPEGTDLVVLNEEGTPEPLVSESAAEILVKGDPVWCPAGQAPGSLGCSASHTGFDDLIADLAGGTYTGDGVIWVESTYDANEDSASIVFDGTNGNLASLSAISVLGGWTGGTTIDPSSPSLLDDALHFINWSGAVSLSNLVVQDALDTSGSIRVETDGDIALTNVTESGNTSSIGVRLDNCLVSGGVCTGTGAITVTDSSFSDNPGGQGLYAISSDDILIKDVTADNNSDDGVELLTEGSIIVKDTTLTDNGYQGLETGYAGGNVTLSNITATGNRDGIVVTNTMGDVSASGITASGNGDGVLIDTTYGNVYASNITSTTNTNDGVEVDNTNGNLTISNVTSDENGDNGFEITNVDGSLKLYCVSAANNGGDGAYINVDVDVVVKCSQFTGNTDDGVDIDLAPTAQLLSVTSSGNLDQDIETDPATTVTVKKVDCSSKKKSSPSGQKGPWTKLYCLPGEIKVALFDTYGDKVEFENLCGYEAGVFDPNSWIYPDTFPGGGEDYITSLQNKMLAEIPNIELNDKFGLPGILAQVLDELPFMLPDGFSYNSAFFTAVLEEGEYMDPLPEESGLTVKFRVPQGLDPDEALTILWWDGLDWVDLGGEYSEDGYYFQVTTEATGVFVLAIFEVES